MHAPFRREDLRELNEDLLSRADEVVAMREIAAGEHHPNVIGLRHDVDNLLEPSRELAEWEERHGYRATYFVLHDAPYWNAVELREALEEIAGRGHEIGIHVNALAVALETGREPAEILASALQRLRGWGHRVIGAVAHGDPLCHRARFVNDEMFLECARPDYGGPTRTLEHDGIRLTIEPRPLAEFGITYEANRLPRALYLSDSGGEWCAPWAEITDAFPHPLGQLHILQHPCWWLDAFPAAVVA